MYARNWYIIAILSLHKDSSCASRYRERRHNLRNRISALRRQSSFALPGSVLRHSIPLKEVQVLIPSRKHEAKQVPYIDSLGAV